LSPFITSTLAFYSVSLTLLLQDLKQNEKYKEEEEEKLNYTTLYYKMKNENYPKPCISPNSRTQVGFYRHQGRGAR